jgi:hypothetical protein
MEAYILEEINRYCSRNAYNLTFIGIGTAPRTNILDQFTSRIDQIMPIFIDLDLYQTIRIIHFDPRFSESIDFLHEYFDSKDIPFKYDNSEGMHVWRSADNTIEIIINSFSFNFTNEFNNTLSNQDWFLEEMVNTIYDKNKLIVQSYSGKDTSIIFRKLYNNSLNQSNFKKNIIFDVGYGENNCDLDPHKYQPIYDKDYNFINILVLNFDELKNYINYNPIIKEFIIKLTIKDYREITDIIPVDIRRKMLIESGSKAVGWVSYKNLYTINSSYEEIIEILKKELTTVIKIFREIKFMTQEKENLLNELLTNFHNYKLNTNPDIYKWTEGFTKIIKD